MARHFIFESGAWLGAGQVTFSISPDMLYYRTRWDIFEQGKEKEKLFQCTQRVEIVGGDQMVNVFMVRPETELAFEITLHNQLLGVYSGLGVVEEKLVAWEFRSKGMLEGYEVYERTKEDEYEMHAEYVSSDGARTMIRGKIWKESKEGSSSE